VDTKKSLGQRIRGWFPREPLRISAQTSQNSERDRAVRLKVASGLLGACGVFTGWYATGRAYVYFTGVGVTSYDATVYSVIVCFFVIAVFWLAAFKLKKIQQYIIWGP
jgi:hypothetical protein